MVFSASKRSVVSDFKLPRKAVHRRNYNLMRIRPGFVQAVWKLHYIDETPAITSSYTSQNEKNTLENTSPAQPNDEQGIQNSGTSQIRFRPHSAAASITSHDTDEAISSPLEYVTPQNRAVLLRYFCQELAPWLDICDPSRHFASVVPVRACQSTTLLNAIYTASARHLVRLRKHRNPQGVIEWQGNTLRSVTSSTAFHFQNECIRDLLKYSLDPDQISNEDLLAASVILRSDEEIDSSGHEDDNDREIFLKVTSAFIDNQIPYHSPLHTHSLPKVGTSRWSGTWLSPSQSATSISSDSSPAAIPPPTPQFAFPDVTPLRNSRSEGLRQACFWVAFRQELHASMMQQRSLMLSLSRSQGFRNFTAAEDATWAHRLAIFCAEVVENTYGGRRTLPGRSKPAIWDALRQQERTFIAKLPESFQPIYSSTEDGTIFPEIWFVGSCHVTGRAYMELAQILLLSFDPRNPTLGPGYTLHRRRLAERLRQITKRLCGMALSNRQAPPVFLNACSAIVMCGEMFEGLAEQKAITWFLELTENELGHPTEKIIKDLQRAWLEGNGCP